MASQAARSGPLTLRARDREMVRDKRLRLLLGHRSLCSRCCRLVTGRLVHEPEIREEYGRGGFVAKRFCVCVVSNEERNFLFSRVVFPSPPPIPPFPLTPSSPPPPPPEAMPPPAQLLISAMILVHMAVFVPPSHAIVAQDALGNIILNGTTSSNAVLINNIEVLAYHSLLSSTAATLAVSISAQKLVIAQYSAQIAAQGTLIQSLQQQASLAFANSPFGKLYVVGGNNASGTLASVERFDGVSWQRVPSLASPRTNMGLCVYKNFLYAIGGSTLSVVLGTVERFDGFAWSATASLRTRRRGLGAAEYEGFLYVVGGTDGTLILSSVERFDGSTWSFAPSLPLPRIMARCVAFNGTLYVYTTDTLDRFSNGQWQPSLLNPYKSGSTYLAFGGNILSLGGVSENGVATTNASRWDFISESWSPIASLKTPRYASCGTVFQGLVYVIGGIFNSTSLLSSVERFNGTAWDSAPSLLVPRMNAAAVVF